MCEGPCPVAGNTHLPEHAFDVHIFEAELRSVTHITHAIHLHTYAHPKPHTSTGDCFAAARIPLNASPGGAIPRLLSTGTRKHIQTQISTGDRILLRLYFQEGLCQSSS